HVGREKEEAEVVDGAIVAARLERLAGALGGVAPEALARVFGQQPVDTGVEALAPVRPQLALAAPAPAHGVHGGVARVVGEDAPGLHPGLYLESTRKGLEERCPRPLQPLAGGLCGKAPGEALASLTLRRIVMGGTRGARRGPRAFSPTQPGDRAADLAPFLRP